VSGWGTGYLTVGTKKLYTFLNSQVEALPEGKDGKNPEGWVITWTSTDPCAEDNKKKYEIVMTGTCDAKKASDLAGSFKAGKGSTCKSAVSYSGPHACITASIPISRYLEQVAPFAGILLIAFGLVMVFVGRKFLL
jgi:hypothetical protein